MPNHEDIKWIFYKKLKLMNPKPNKISSHIDRYAKLEMY